ncbi:MAG: hypothetical protein K0Q72_4878 [Armatimonadetes bacterium]|jgi:hypothetical protein|nr:hypothetical protein [Armatimonadota bacterium]
MKLTEEERELLMTEVAQALDHVHAPELRVTYGELFSAVDQSEVPEELMPPLETLLEVGLQSGRIRKVHLAPGETAARRLFARTPRGQATQGKTAEVNEALRALAGHQIEEVSITQPAPGSFSLLVATDQGKLQLRLDREGVRLQSLEIG